jgi:hypothetical protein
MKRQRVAHRQTSRYTEHMFRYRDDGHRLGSRRVGGPVLLKDLLPDLLKELHEVHVARSGLPLLDTAAGPGEPGVELEAASASLSRAA